MPKVQEYKDANGKNRIRQIAENGKISDATHQGYFNIQDARNGKIDTSIEYIKHYWNQMSIAQKATIENFIRNNPS